MNGGAGGLLGAPAGTPGVDGGSGGGGGGGGEGRDISGPTGTGGKGGDGGFGGGAGMGGSANTIITSSTATAGDGGIGGDFGGGGFGGPIIPIVGNSIGGSGGNGGFAGGAGGGGGVLIGGGPLNIGGNGGTGGFGSGGGGSGIGAQFGSIGKGGPFGGDGGGGSGGGGAGLGGTIFVQTGSELTIELTMNYTGTLFQNSSTNPGLGGGVGAQDGETAGTDIFMMSSSLLTFDLSQNTTVPTPIESEDSATPPAGGGLTKEGSANLILTGDNTYTGTTTVSNGQLQVANGGSVITDIDVMPTGKLTGTFSILRNGNLSNDGLVEPGVGGKGQINVDGNYSQSGSGTFSVDITPTGTDNNSLFVSPGGTATLAGRLLILAETGNYIKGKTYEIINAPTLGTEFDTSQLIGAVAPDLAIAITYSSVIITILEQRIFLHQIINSGPPREVADCFLEANLVFGTDFALIVELLGTLNNKQVNAALTSFSPVRFGALEWINARNNSYVADLLSDHVFQLCCGCDCGASVWITGFGNFMDNFKRLDNLRSFDSNAGGVLLGIDSCCNPCFHYGASLGYSHSGLNWGNDGGGGDLNSYFGALYGSWHCGCFSLDGSALGGGTNNDLDRNITFSSIDRTARSDFWSYFFTAHLGGRARDWCCSTWEPFALVDYHYYHRDHFKEKGANSLDLRVKSKDQHMLRGEAGLRWYCEFDRDCYCFAPYLGASWVGEFPLHKSKQKASFVNQSCVMDVTSYDSSVQLGSPEAGIKLTYCDGSSFTVGYKGLFNDKTRINQFEARVDWGF